MGFLDVYNLEPDDHTGLNMTLAASLELPFTKYAPPPPQGVAWMNNEPSAIHLQCCSDPVYQPVTSGSFVRGAPTVFETSNTGRIL
jgi:hypothetical protein